MQAPIELRRVEVAHQHLVLLSPNFHQILSAVKKKINLKELELVRELLSAFGGTGIEILPGKLSDPRWRLVVDRSSHFLTR